MKGPVQGGSANAVPGATFRGFRQFLQDAPDFAAAIAFSPKCEREPRPEKPNPDTGVSTLFTTFFAGLLANGGDTCIHSAGRLFPATMAGQLYRPLDPDTLPVMSDTRAGLADIIARTDSPET